MPRSELFICGSVLSNRARGFDAALSASARGCRENMNAFAVGGIDYVDMMMLDYPGPDAESIRGQWAALEQMQAAKLTRSIAVSNFSPAQLDVILADPKATPPAVNQLPIGVGYKVEENQALLAANKKRGVLVQAWSPLRVLGPKAQAACAEVGRSYGKSGAQVALKWLLQSGATFTTQSRSRGHIAESIALFDFTLTTDEMARLTAVRD